MFPRVCVALLAIVNWTNLAFSQQENDEVIQATTAKRFLQIVERNPQRGTALGKVFSYHSQMGTLDTFIGELQQRTQSDPQDGVAWMLLGLFESQRRMDPAAILAFSEAEKLRPNDAFPAYYRGQCLLRMGEPTQAADAFEIAIQRKPTRIILLEVFEQLGRTHLRQNRKDLAIGAWTRLEALFPNDLHVLEQIASIQNQEGDYQNALPRYERLITLAKEPTQCIQYRIETAQLRIRLGNGAQGLEELETILSELKPDGWLYRDVQSKIEDDFLKSNDLRSTLVNLRCLMKLRNGSHESDLRLQRHQNRCAIALRDFRIS
jgi:tetratricopeptide (TPR) repeat protein